MIQIWSILHLTKLLRYCVNRACLPTKCYPQRMRLQRRLCRMYSYVFRCLRFFVFYVFVKKFNLFIVVFNEFYVVIKFLSIVGNPVQYFANWRFIAIYDWRLVEYDFYYFWQGQFIFMISQWSKSCENYAKIDENFTNTSFN